MHPYYATLGNFATARIRPTRQLMTVGRIDRRRIEAVGVLNLDPTLGGRSAPLEFADDVADHIGEPVLSLDYTGRVFVRRHSNIIISSTTANNTTWLVREINLGFYLSLQYVGRGQHRDKLGLAMDADFDHG